MWTPFQAGSLLLCYPLTTVAWGTKSIHIPGYCIYKDIEVVETQISLEFSWTLKLRSTHLTVSFTTFKVFTCLEMGALNFSFRRNAFPLVPFSWYRATQFMMSTTYLNPGSKKLSRSDRSIQAKAEKVKSVNKTGISADQCRILMKVTSNLTDLMLLSEWWKWWK